MRGDGLEDAGLDYAVVSALSSAYFFCCTMRMNARTLSDALHTREDEAQA